MKEPLASRVLFPLTERRFTYAEYGRFLDRLGDRHVVPLREFALGDGDLALRHDVDSRLESALELAGLEHDRGLRGTYFVLHTAPYWDDPDLLPRLRQLQELGHEVGLHHDLLTLERLHGADVRAVAERELRRLRDGGIEVSGAAAHGSPWCHRLGFHNNYVFAGWDEPIRGFPSTDVREKLDPRELGLRYEAYHLAYEAYFSDSAFEAGHRQHPSSFELQPGRRTVMLVHPCHWDSSAPAKLARLGSRVARKLRRAEATRGQQS
jgi:hypothetical protein